MPSKRKQQFNKKPDELHLGLWLARLQIKPTTLAKETGLSEAYLSELISGKKNNPSTDVSRDIAGVLGIPVEYLYRRPPAKDALDSLGGIDGATIDRLRRS